jgi:hypothetical protein
MNNGIQHESQGRYDTLRVFFSQSVALKMGQGLCNDLDYVGTETGQALTDSYAKRSNVVQLPDATNNLAFAGVARMDYDAVPGGQWIDMILPGSVYELAIGFPTTANATVLTCSASTGDKGRFTFQGLPGRGTALALQTVAAASGPLFQSLDGSATCATVAGVCTITKAGIGTACGYLTTTVYPTGMTAVVLAGADNATSLVQATAGEYTIASANSANTITVATTALGDSDLTLYVIQDNPTCLCYLFDGEESGLQQVINPKSAAAVAAMVGGLTLVAGGYTLAGNSTFTMADGTRENKQKAFGCLGILTTSVYIVTITSGLKMDGSTGITTFSVNAAHEFAKFQWNGAFGLLTGGVWQLQAYVGATFA